MANQNLFVHISVFVCFVYIVFIVAVKFSWNSFTDLLDLKSFRDERLKSDPRPTAANFVYTSNSFFHETSHPVQGIDVSPPSSVYPAPPSSRKFTGEGEMMGDSELQQKNDAGLNIARATEKNLRDSLGSVIKEEPHYNCSKSLLLWCSKTSLGRQGTFFCKKCQCYMKVTRSLNVTDVQNADIVLFYHMIDKPWQKLVR